MKKDNCWSEQSPENSTVPFFGGPPGILDWTLDYGSKVCGFDSCQCLALLSFSKMLYPHCCSPPRCINGYPVQLESSCNVIVIDKSNCNCKLHWRQSNCNCNWKSEANVIVIVIIFAKCYCTHPWYLILDQTLKDSTLSRTPKKLLIFHYYSSGNVNMMSYAPAFKFHEMFTGM